MRSILNIVTIDDAIGTLRKVYPKSKKSYYVYIFQCSECPNTVEVKKYGIKNTTGKCHVCCQRKKPYESIYNCLVINAKERDLKVDLTFEEFLEFTKIDNCHYCNIFLNRKAFKDRINSKSHTAAYLLDRKDSALGYAKENLVSCCSPCNYLKSDKLSYEEFMLLSPALKLIQEKRKSNV